MDRVRALKDTLLASAIFVLVSVAIWWVCLGPRSAAASIRDMVIVAPIVWLVLVARREVIRPGMGALAGALIGLLVGLVPLLLDTFWESGAGRSGDEAGFLGATGIILYGIATVVGTSIGAGVGALVATMQRRGVVGQRSSASAR
jgi:hypothetical protein